MALKSLRILFQKRKNEHRRLTGITDVKKTGRPSTRHKENSLFLRQLPFFVWQKSLRYASQENMLSLFSFHLMDGRKDHAGSVSVCVFGFIDVLQKFIEAVESSGNHIRIVDIFFWLLLPELKWGSVFLNQTAALYDSLNNRTCWTECSLFFLHQFNQFFGFALIPKSCLPQQSVFDIFSYARILKAPQLTIRTSQDRSIFRIGSSGEHLIHFFGLVFVSGKSRSMTLGSTRGRLHVGSQTVIYRYDLFEKTDKILSASIIRS